MLELLNKCAECIHVLSDLRGRAEQHHVKSAKFAVINAFVYHQFVSIPCSVKFFPSMPIYVYKQIEI